jgi:serine/threonine protein kinase
MIFEADTPSVSNFSDDFNDLLRNLLEKDPTRRISWHELKQHPFWYSTSPVYQFKKNVFYPEQPQFDKYLIMRGINPKHFYEQKNNPLADKLLNPAASGGNVDILRLSMNVKRNMLKEQEMEGKSEADDNYHTKDNQAKQGRDKQGAKTGEEKSGDINLTDRNVVLNFAEEGAEESSAQQEEGPSKAPQQVDSARGPKGKEVQANVFHPPSSNQAEDPNSLLSQVAAAEDTHSQQNSN